LGDKGEGEERRKQREHTKNTGKQEKRFTSFFVRSKNMELDPLICG